MGKVFVGHDWAEVHHDVYVEDAGGHRLGKTTLAEGVDGVARSHELVAPLVQGPADVVMGTRNRRTCSAVELPRMRVRRRTITARANAPAAAASASQRE